MSADDLGHLNSHGIRKNLHKAYPEDIRLLPGMLSLGFLRSLTAVILRSGLLVLFYIPWRLIGTADVLLWME